MIWRMPNTYIVKVLWISHHTNLRGRECLNSFIIYTISICVIGLYFQHHLGRALVNHLKIMGSFVRTVHPGWCCYKSTEPHFKQLSAFKQLDYAVILFFFLGVTIPWQSVFWHRCVHSSLSLASSDIFCSTSGTKVSRTHENVSSSFMNSKPYCNSP